MIDAAIAAELGFPKLKYAFVERERRWLCERVPTDGVLWSERITDLYVEGARLRLREARRLDSDEAMRAFPQPLFAVQEVTADTRYAGGALVRDGLPS